MIITAFTIAKDYAEAKELKIKKYRGKECLRCSSNVHYTSNTNCVKCQDGRNVKQKSGKSPKVEGEFYCKYCLSFLPIARLSRTIKTSKGSWSLCITHDKEAKEREAKRAAPQKP